MRIQKWVKLASKILGDDKDYREKVKLKRNQVELVCVCVKGWCLYVYFGLEMSHWKSNIWVKTLTQGRRGPWEKQGVKHSRKRKLNSERTSSGSLLGMLRSRKEVA